jgi:hypothetical protein
LRKNFFPEEKGEKVYKVDLTWMGIVRPTSSHRRLKCFDTIVAVGELLARSALANTLY